MKMEAKEMRDKKRKEEKISGFFSCLNLGKK